MKLNFQFGTVYLDVEGPEPDVMKAFEFFKTSVEPIIENSKDMAGTIGLLKGTVKLMSEVSQPTHKFLEMYKDQNELFLRLLEKLERIENRIDGNSLPVKES